MPDRPKPKPVNSKSVNSERRNGKAPKKHPKQPVHKRTPEQLAEIQRQKDAERAKRREVYEAQQAEIARQQKELAEEREREMQNRAAEKNAKKKRMSDSQRRRAAAQQAAAQVAKATLNGGVRQSFKENA